MTSTFFALMAEFGTPHIPLEVVAEKYWKLSRHEAFRRACLHQLPIPAFKGGESQKAGWFVDANDLAKYCDNRRAEANKAWDRMNS